MMPPPARTDVGRGGAARQDGHATAHKEHEPRAGRLWMHLIENFEPWVVRFVTRDESQGNQKRTAANAALKVNEQPVKMERPPKTATVSPTAITLTKRSELVKEQPVRTAVSVVEWWGVV